MKEVPIQIKMAIDAAVIGLLEAPERRKVIFIQSKKLAVTATRRFRPRDSERITEIVLTIGQPNYGVRKMIAKEASKSGSTPPFLHYKEWPKKRKARS